MDLSPYKSFARGHIYAVEQALSGSSATHDLNLINNLLDFSRWYLSTETLDPSMTLRQWAPEERPNERRHKEVNMAGHLHRYILSLDQYRLSDGEGDIR